MPTVRSIVRDVGAAGLPVLVTRAGHREEPGVSDAVEGRAANPRLAAQTRPSAVTAFLNGQERHTPCRFARCICRAGRFCVVSARPWPCRCSTRWCRPSRRWRRRPRRRRSGFGAVYIPHGAIMDRYTPAKAGTGFDFTPILKPLAAVQGQPGRRQQPRPPGHRRQPRHRVGRVAERRDRQEDRRPGLPPGADHRPGHRQADWRRHAVPVDRSGHREPRRLRRRLQPGLRLRLHEHHLLVVGDDAGADGDQPARGVRAPVRPARHAGAAHGARAKQDASILDSVTADLGDLESGLGPRDKRALDEYLDEHPRDRAADPAHRAAQQRRAVHLARRADRRAGVVSGARGPDVRPDGGGLPGRPDPRGHVHDGARSQHEDLSGDRHHRAAPHDLAPPREAGREDGARLAQHLPHVAVRQVHRQAEGDARRRRHAARPLDDLLRQRHEQRERARSVSAAARGASAAGRARATGTS